MNNEATLQNKDEILSRLAALRDDVRRIYKVELKGIFGSLARGEATTQSDIDVLVEFLTGADLFDFVGLSQFLEEQLNCSVDVVPEADIRAELRERILQETIYL